jgi:magnesium-transporting ATPase (P-type)
MIAPFHSGSPYALPVAEVFRSLETAPEGLAPAEAADRLRLYGPNAVAEPPPPPWWWRLARHFRHGLAGVLFLAGLAAAIAALLGGSWLLVPVIWSVILINAAISFIQEAYTERTVRGLAKVLPTYARVVRAGTEAILPGAELVPGDVLVLAEGDNIPADARVVEEYGLRVNNATLTGETTPARKTAEASVSPDYTELERANLVFAGTSVVSGTGRAVIYATGMLTQFGRIAHLSQEAREEPSPLRRELERITRRITLLALGLAALVFVVGRFELGMGDLEAATLALGILVAAVPEGLLPTMTLSLARAVQRLAERHVLVKRLASVETVGAISVLCTDKSGTLTQNQMTVREAWVAGQRLSVSGVGYDPAGEFSPNPAAAGVAEPLEVLLTAAMLCNNARLNPPTPERPRWTHVGDQTEAALRSVALKGGLDEQILNGANPRIHELPFDARRRRMSTIHRTRQGEVAFVKGAPREVLALCSHALWADGVRPLDDAGRAAILAANDDYARSALRVLALARRRLPPRAGSYSTGRVERDLTFLGLLAMMDPPRPEVAAAVETLRGAGIRLVIITGDYGLTAESFARRVGMLSGPSPRIVTGVEVEALGDAELAALLRDEVIFARVAPEHKLRVVAAFQALGEVVAVIGDGVNDAPALRRADIGIAMGVSGTDVAREAADIILTNDNFAAIVAAVEEGRGVYDNIRKFATYIFASNVPEVVPFLARALASIPLALSVLQILAIDLGTDLFPALALGIERPEPDVMRRRPRSRSRPLFGTGLFSRAFLWLGMIEAVLCYAAFFSVYYLFGYRDPLNLPMEGESPVFRLASTAFYAGVVMAQVGNAYACRTENEPFYKALGRNWLLLVGVLLELLILWALVYVPAFARVLNHIALPLDWWVWLGAFPLILLALEELRKAFARRVQRPPRARAGVREAVREGENA